MSYSNVKMGHIKYHYFLTDLRYGIFFFVHCLSTLKKFFVLYIYNVYFTIFLLNTFLIYSYYLYTTGLKCLP